MENAKYLTMVALLLQWVSFSLDRWGVKQEEIKVGISGLKSFVIVENDFIKGGAVLPPPDVYTDYPKNSLYMIRFLVVVAFLLTLAGMCMNDPKLLLGAGISGVLGSLIWNMKLRSINRDNNKVDFDLGASYIANTVSGLLLIGLSIMMLNQA